MLPGRRGPMQASFPFLLHQRPRLLMFAQEKPPVTESPGAFRKRICPLTAAAGRLLFGTDEYERRVDKRK
jgi:hypothetical protein